VIESPDQPEHDQHEGDHAEHCQEIGHVAIVTGGSERDLNDWLRGLNNS
jgi:hypothetical protein